MDRVFVLCILKRKEIKIRLTVKMNANPRRLLDPKLELVEASEKFHN